LENFYKRFKTLNCQRTFNFCYKIVIFKDVKKKVEKIYIVFLYY